jgi:hypothetical protein
VACGATRIGNIHQLLDSGRAGQPLTTIDRRRPRRLALVDFINGKDGAAMLRACDGYDGDDERFKKSA